MKNYLYESMDDVHAAREVTNEAYGRKKLARMPLSQLMGLPLVRAAGLNEKEAKQLVQVASGDYYISDFKSLYEKLFKYYNSHKAGDEQMPSSIAGAKTGDPDKWIQEKVERL